MAGDRATRVLGLMLCLLCLTNGQCQDEVRQVIENAEAAKMSNLSLRKASEEMLSEWNRHVETMQNILVRGPPEMLTKIQPLYQHMDASIDKVKKELLGLKEEHGLLELSLARAKREFGHLLEKVPKDEL